MRLTPAREIAYDAYLQVMDQNRRPQDVLDEMFEERGKQLKRVDRNFIKEIVFGSLRWQSKIFWILQNTSKRDLESTTPEIRACLVCGTYQIFYMDRVPDRAAVNESVEYLRKKGQANATSFGNGILRQIARRAAYFPKPDKEKKPQEYLALQYAHPRWVVDRWSKHFRFERMEKILASNNVPPPHSVRINTLKVPTEQIRTIQDDLLRDERTHSEKRNLRCALRLKESPNFDHESLFQKGFYTVQDEASQLVGLITGVEPEQTVIDCCAGPGGKLSHMYELGAGKAKIYAIERSKIQYRRAMETCERLGATENIEWFQEDFLRWDSPEPADRLLLDAPCTGLGVLRRHPEGKWHKDEAAIATLASKQRELLAHGLRQLKVGGRLIYSVCSFEPEETTDQLKWLKKEYGDKIQVVSPVSYLPDYFKKYVTRDNILLIYSGNQDEMDGFGAFIVQVNDKI